MPEMSAQALRTAVIKAAVSEEAFRKDLKKDAGTAIEARFGKQPHALNVSFEGENDLTFLIPQKTDKLYQAISRAVSDVGQRSPTRGEFQTIVVHKAWSDQGFMGKLRTDSRGAINDALGKYGASVPAAASVRVYEEQPGECRIVVPRPAESGAELSDAELEAVAGGEAAVIIVTGAVVGAIATVIADKIISVSA